MSHKFKHVGYKTKWPHFEYEPVPLCGVGENHTPIVSMDKYIDTSANQELHLECCKGLALVDSYKMSMFPGTVHPSEAERGKVNFSEMLANMEKYDPNGIHKKNILEIENTTSEPRKAIYKYMYYAMGATIPWFFSYYLREQNFSGKTHEPKVLWSEEAKKHFPNLIEYIHKLPFKNIGRVLFFTTYPNAGVPAHRDYYVVPHRDHNINLFFSAGWRPSFIWDDINNKKIYLPEGATSYFFNNRDYHGVDPEPMFRYTLRVDGTFEDWLQDELGLKNGFV